MGILLCASASFFSGPYAFDMMTTFVASDVIMNPNQLWSQAYCFLDFHFFCVSFAVNIITMLQEKVNMGTFFCAPPKTFWFFVLPL